MRNLDNEREILRELADGNESVFVQVFDQYSPKIYGLALKFLNSKEVAEEVVQDVFMDIWVNRVKLPDILNLGAYIHGMAKKKIYDAYRNKTDFVEWMEGLNFREPAENATERMLQEIEHEKLLQEVVRELPEHQRKIFQLAWEEGLTHQMIAQRMNLTRLAVKSHMKRILHYIRTRLEPVLKAESFVWLLLFTLK